MKLVLKFLNQSVLGFEFDRERRRNVSISKPSQSQELQEPETEEQIEKYKEQAFRDPLTGLHNRRYFQETGENELERADRYGHQEALLMADINKFKQVNDRYSHPKGDKVLNELANLFQETVRGSDTVARYGGDEFLILLPETGQEVEIVKQRLRKAVEKWNTLSDLNFPLSLAIGISRREPNKDKDLQQLIEEADRRMYLDKEKQVAGR